MSILRTADDLRADALFRAGESSTDTTGSFWSKSLDYINRTYQALLLGGSIAVGRDLATSAGIYAHLVDLPITDWWWGRSLGVFNTLAVQQRTGSGTLTQNDTSVTVTSAFTTDPTGHYVVVQGQPTVLRVQSVPSPTSIIFDAAYPDDTVASPTLFVAKMEYDLPSDFIRFSSSPYVHSFFGSTLDVASVEQRSTDWPLAVVRQGRPTRSFRTAQGRIAVNAFDTRGYRVEFEYIANPALLVAGSEPRLPLHHRAVLASGAAMLMAFDKGDSRADNFASEFRELVGRMVQEHRRALGAGSSTFSMFRVRNPRMLMRAPQPFGELFLI